MPNPERLQEIENLKGRWKKLETQRIALEAEYDVETRQNERFFQENNINSKKEEQKKLEAEWILLENEEKLEFLRTQLFTFKRNRAYPEAFDAACMIQQIIPDDADIAADISSLQEKIEHRERAIKALGQLIAHIGELGMSFYQKIAPILRPQNPLEDNISLLLPPTEQYLAGLLNTEQYIQICEMLMESLADSNPVDYAALAQQIMDGDTILFLGSHIPCLYDKDCEDEINLAGELAQAVKYDNFNGNLSSIAEYYQIKYGQKPLIKNLKQILPNNSPNIPLYQKLAQSKCNLIIVSATYDNLLEEAFTNTGKPFVELLTIIHSVKKDYKIGDVVVRFPDNQEKIFSQEKLSKQNLLEQYSIIYKIRGTCAIEGATKTVLPHTLALSESNYFTLAKYADKLIPDFLISSLLDKYILFIGFTPNSWEDRLLAGILLDKHKESGKIRYTIGRPNDRLEDAYWSRQTVERYIDFKELDKSLQEAIS